MANRQEALPRKQLRTVPATAAPQTTEVPAQQIQEAVMANLHEQISARAYEIYEQRA
jgi:hypothetical protein